MRGWQCHHFLLSAKELGNNSTFFSTTEILYNKAVKENIDKIGNIEIDFYFHKNHHMEKKTTNDRKKNVCKFYYSGLINVVNKKHVKIMRRKQQPYNKNGQVIRADNLHKNKCK